jgi:general secretion pathway protein G
MGKKAGFTLLELLIVIAVLGILAGIIVPVAGAAIEQARIARATSEVNALAQALKSLYTDTAYWPKDNDISDAAGWTASRNGIQQQDGSFTGWKGPYVQVRANWCMDPWGRAYYYDGGGNLGNNETGAGQWCVMSLGRDGANNGSIDNSNRQAQGDDIVVYLR